MINGINFGDTVYYEMYDNEVLNKLENIINYIRRHAKIYISIDTIKKMVVPYFIFMGCMPLVIGIILQKYIFATIMMSITTFFAILVSVLWYRVTSITYCQRFLISGIFSSFISVSFLLMSFFIIEIEISNIPTRTIYCVSLGLAWVLTVICIFSFKINNILKGKYQYLEAGRKSSSLLATSTVGAIFGIILMRFASKLLSQQLLIHVGIILSFFTAILASLGIPHILISYFVKKYSISGESIPIIRKKASAKKRMAIKVLLIFFVIIAIMTILGVLVDKRILK